jgi:hypothetical protein
VYVAMVAGLHTEIGMIAMKDEQRQAGSW